jgi:aminoglycoside 6'-N-acetyltransferase
MPRRFRGSEMTFSWRRLTEADFPLLASWLAEPHVARWWHHETSPQALARDFGPAARGDEPSEDLLVLLDGEPLGLVQRLRIADFPEYLAELTPIVDVPDGSFGIDYLIGDVRQTGRGIGPRMIRAIVERTWSDYSDASCLIMPVSAANRTSWRALEKAGLRRIAEGELEPDNPIDNRNHVIYRIDRPDRG